MCKIRIKLTFLFALFAFGNIYCAENSAPAIGCDVSATGDVGFLTKTKSWASNFGAGVSEFSQKVFADSYDAASNMSREDFLTALKSLSVSFLTNYVTFEAILLVANSLIPGSGLLWWGLVLGTAIPLSLTGVVENNVATYFGVKDCTACEAAWGVGSALADVFPFVLPLSSVYSFAKNSIRNCMV